jgi:hypothetical protein
MPFLKPPERPFSTGHSLLKALFDFKEIKFSKFDDKLSIEMVNFKDDNGFSLLARKTSNTMILKIEGRYYLVDGLSDGRLSVRSLDGSSVDDGVLLKSNCYALLPKQQFLHSVGIRSYQVPPTAPQPLIISAHSKQKKAPYTHATPVMARQPLNLDMLSAASTCLIAPQHQ